MQGEIRVSVPSIVVSPPHGSKRQPVAAPRRLLKSGFISRACLVRDLGLRRGAGPVRHALGWALVVLLFYLCVDAGIEGYKSVGRALFDRG